MKLGNRIPPEFNSGFFMFPRRTMDLHVLDAALGEVRTLENGTPVEGNHDGLLYVEGWDYYAEQSLVGLSAMLAAAEMLPPEFFLRSNTGMFVLEPDRVPYTEIVRHFYGTVRHRLYTSGMPHVLRNMRHAGASF